MGISGILLVDDDRLITATLGRGLRDAGYTVCEAAFADEALELVGTRSVAIELAVVDINMPGMSGIELAGVLKRDFDIATLIFSAYSSPQMVESAVHQGVVGYLVKPLDLPQMLPAVETALARARELRAMEETQRQLEKAVSRSRKISVAVGITMMRRDCSEQQAFEILRSQARSHRMRLEELAEEIAKATETFNKVANRS